MLSISVAAGVSVLEPPLGLVAALVLALVGGLLLSHALADWYPIPLPSSAGPADPDPDPIQTFDNPPVLLPHPREVTGSSLVFHPPLLLPTDADMAPIAEREPWVQLLGDYDDELGSVCCVGHECLDPQHRGCQNTRADICAVPRGPPCQDGVTRSRRRGWTPCIGRSDESVRAQDPAGRHARGRAHGAEPGKRRRRGLPESSRRRSRRLKQHLASEGSPVENLCDRALMKLLQVNKALLHARPTNGGCNGVSIKERVGTTE
eukprot:m.20162 g.20162  ORF g.20162 m.20162 type:complete len:262 (-) comp10145_c0_seq1:21-806(-)